MSRSVLIIDDDEPSVRLARAVLEADDWRVLHAADGAGAREILRTFRPALIVTALGVQRSAALEGLRELRASAGEIPIVAVTVLNGPETEYQVLQAGCRVFIRKPIDVSAFSAQLGAVVGGSR